MQDNIVYGKPLGPRVLSVSPLEDYRLSITFTNGEQRIFDAKPLLSIGVFQKLQSKHFFDSVKVAFGSVQWPQDIDYCPDTLYAQSTPAK